MYDTNEVYDYAVDEARRRLRFEESEEIKKQVEEFLSRGNSVIRVVGTELSDSITLHKVNELDLRTEYLTR